MSLRPRALPAGFIAPCLPTKAPTPSGAEWLKEIKHDGFRVIARKHGAWVKLYSRPGNDLTDRFPLIVEALARLRAHSCIIDGEAVSCGGDGIASFEQMRDWRHGDTVFLWAFDLIELNGDDLRRVRCQGNAGQLDGASCAGFAPQRAPRPRRWSVGIRACLPARSPSR